MWKLENNPVVAGSLVTKYFQQVLSVINPETKALSDLLVQKYETLVKNNKHTNKDIQNRCKKKVV